MNKQQITYRKITSSDHEIHQDCDYVATSVEIGPYRKAVAPPVILRVRKTKHDDSRRWLAEVMIPRAGSDLPEIHAAYSGATRDAAVRRAVREEVAR